MHNLVLSLGARPERSLPAEALTSTSAGRSASLACAAKEMLLASGVGRKCDHSPVVVSQVKPGYVKKSCINPLFNTIEPEESSLSPPRQPAVYDRYRELQELLQLNTLTRVRMARLKKKKQERKCDVRPFRGSWAKLLGGGT